MGEHIKALQSEKKDKATGVSGDSKVSVEFLQILSDDECTENIFFEVHLRTSQVNNIVQ